MVLGEDYGNIEVLDLRTLELINHFQILDEEEFKAFDLVKTAGLNEVAYLGYSLYFFLVT